MYKIWACDRQITHQGAKCLPVTRIQVVSPCYRIQPACVRRCNHQKFLTAVKVRFSKLCEWGVGRSGIWRLSFFIVSRRSEKSQWSRNFWNQTLRTLKSHPRTACISGRGVHYLNPWSLLLLLTAEKFSVHNKKGYTLKLLKPSGNFTYHQV
jgi:hypothetical protein